MGESSGYLPLKSQHPFVQLLVSLITLLAISTLLLAITLLLSRLIFGREVTDLDLSGAITSSQRLYLGLIQAMSQVSIFLVPGLVISWLFTLDISSWLGFNLKLSLHTIVLVLLIALSVMPLTTLSGIINSQMSLPPFLSALEAWMISKEEEAQQLTGHLIYASNYWSLGLNILILALIPALGEEIFFRGVLQQIFQKWFRSSTLGVIFTALIFSTLHLQFYGFLPRFILGLLFGYLFLWSRSIWIPIIAHMVNNSVPVIAAYFLGWESINNNLEEKASVSIIFWIVIVVLPVAGMILFRERFRSESG